MFVDERAVLPVLQPFAPVPTVIGRLPNALEQVLTAHGHPADFIASEIAGMADYWIEPTTNRATLGIMNEFSALAAAYSEPEEAVNLVTSPCAGGEAMYSLCGRHGSPELGLAALVASNRQQR